MNHHLMQRFHILIQPAMLILTSCMLISSPGIQAANKTVNQIVAVVNQQVITQLQLERAMHQNKGRFAAHHQPLPSSAELRQHTLDQLIDTRLQLDFAADHQISIDHDEQQQCVERIAKSQHQTPTQLRASLQNFGYTAEGASQLLADQCLVGKIQEMVISPKIHIAPEEIALLQKQYAAEQGPNTYHLSDLWISLPDDPNAAQIDAATKQAKRLRAEAMQHHQSLQTIAGKQPTGSGVHWQDLGQRTAAELPTLYNDALHQLKAHEVSQPIVAGNGIHLLQMLDAHTSHGLTQDQALNILYHRQFNIDLENWVAELRADGYVHIEPTAHPTP